MARDRESTFFGTIWLVGSNLFRLGMAFALIPVLTRLLSPEDYGLFNLVFPLIITLTCAADLGFSPVLVRSVSKNPTQETTVLLISILGGAVISLILFASSEAIERRMGQPGLSVLLRECTIVLVLGAVCSAPFARLQREGKMLGFAIGDVAGVVLGGVVAIVAAWNGAGVQSLVLQQAVSIIARLSIAVFIGKFEVVFALDKEFISRNAKFAFYSFNSIAMNVITKSVDSLLIGFLHGAYALGLYSIAMQVVRLPESLVVGPIYTTLLPAFSHAVRERRDFVNLYTASMFLVFSFCLSALCGIGLVSADIVALFLGSKWEGAAPILMVLIIYAFGNCINVVQQAALLGLENAKIPFQISCFSTMGVVVGILVGSQWGVLGAVIGVSLSNLATGLAMMVAVCRLLEIPTSTVLRQAVLPLAAAVTMAMSIVISRDLLLAVDPFVRLGSLISIGGSVFISVYLLGGGYTKLQIALGSLRIRGEIPGHIDVDGSSPSLRPARS
ncbi:oligosaccharide flippase family protein [Methylobacterium sp. Leaf117]|uniref:oligosaccharide flippase family protein n=1 Tax=Methylobacterium sp. Leaf117 TaxID=1736260 RepID=UPI000725A7C4|nr:oligosaccharide flippase family protein [Methylobacterium sp. Leaf117]KQP91679.1 hypothetical protein ASF57_03900 [Methylobacterium sp. Leaf117]